MRPPVHGLNRRKRIAETMMVLGAVLFVPTFLAVVMGYAVAIAFAVMGLGMMIVAGLRLSRMLYDVKQGLLFHWLTPRDVTFRFDLHHGLSPTQLKTFAQLEAGANSWRKNMLFGIIAGVPFVSSDVITETSHERFIGRVTIFDFSCPFQQSLSCIKRTDVNEEESIDVHATALTRLKRYFHVNATDEAFARQVLTPHLVDTMLKLHARNPGDVRLTIQDAKLTIAIDKQEVFRFRLLKPISEKLFVSLQDDFKLFKQMVEDVAKNDAWFVKKEPTLR